MGPGRRRRTCRKERLSISTTGQDTALTLHVATAADMAPREKTASKAAWRAHRRADIAPKTGAVGRLRNPRGQSLACFGLRETGLRTRRGKERRPTSQDPPGGRGARRGPRPGRRRGGGRRHAPRPSAPRPWPLSWAAARLPPQRYAGRRLVVRNFNA